MAEKYCYNIGLPIQEAANLIERRGKEEGFNIENSGTKVTIGKAKLVGDIEVWYRQIFFSADLREEEDVTIVQGGFSLHKGLYRIHIAFILFVVLFLMIAGDIKFIFTLPVLLMFCADFLTTKWETNFRKFLLRKEKKAILDFLEALAKEHPVENNRD